MNKRLVEAVKNALHQDNTIAVDITKLGGAKGHTEEHMAYLGLKKTDLKKLERAGLAIRGYFISWDKTNLGAHKSGHKAMWVLVGRGGNNDIV